MVKNHCVYLTTATKNTSWNWVGHILQQSWLKPVINWKVLLWYVVRNSCIIKNNKWKNRYSREGIRFPDQSSEHLTILTSYFYGCSKEKTNINKHINKYTFTWSTTLYFHVLKFSAWQLILEIWKLQHLCSISCSWYLEMLEDKQNHETT